MSFPWVSFVVVSFNFAFAMASNSERLFVTESSSLDRSRRMRTLTCMSEDDDAAFVWNYDLNENVTSNNSNAHTLDFMPVKPISNKVLDCAIWESKSCSVSWINKTGWTMVSSLEEPMGPVFDYRWEGFNEYILNNVTGKKKLDDLLQIDRLDRTVIFSIRGTRDIEIHMCNKNSTSSWCLLIKIAIDGTHSVIETCLSETSRNKSEFQNQTCNVVDNVEHETAVLDAYEWRTFRLRWISNEEKIKLFKDVDEEAFLVGQVRQWPLLRNISVQSVAQARIRFHHYDYFLTTFANALLTTEKFVHRNENFCINMLVSLCPNCQLNFSLTNSKNGNAMAYTSIFGSKNLHSNGLRNWQSFKVNMTLPSSTLPTFVTLKITSFLSKDNGDDIWWAIDKMRFRKATDGIRESTLTVPISASTKNVLKIKCQKLLSSKIVVADLSTSKPSNDIRQLRRIVREPGKPYPPGCRIFRKVKSDSFGYRCHRELYEKNDEPCFDLLPGEKNVTFIRISNSKMCPAIRGSYQMKVFTESADKVLNRGCPNVPCMSDLLLIPDTIYTVRVISKNGSTLLEKKIKTLEPAPGKIRNLVLKYDVDFVVGNWKPPLNETERIKNYTVKIERIALLGCKDLQKESPAEPVMSKTVEGTTATFTGLHPYAEYNFTVIANTDQPGPPQGKVFRTNQLNESTSQVSKLRYDNKSYLTWDAPENCTTITGPLNVTKLIFSYLSDPRSNWSLQEKAEGYRFNLEPCNLLPYTRYKVRARFINSNNVQELNFTTPPAAPPAVTDFGIYEADAASNTISIKWKPPHPPNGIIQSYQVSMIKGNTCIKNWSIEVSELKKCAHSFVCFENLSILSNTSTEADLQLQIFAKNVNVTTAGDVTLKGLNLKDLCDAVPDKPESVEVSQQNHGIVTLKWMYPLFTPTKIVHYRIEVEFLQTNLSTNPPKENQTLIYTIPKREPVHSKELYLLSATDYVVRMVAVNYCNKSSEVMERKISTPAAPAFASESELYVESNKTVIILTVPAVVDATKNTTVVVRVKGLLECVEKSSENLSPSCKNIKSTNECVLVEDSVKSIEPVPFIFNINQTYGVKKNYKFLPDETYVFEVTVRDWYSTKTHTLKSSVVTFESWELSLILNKILLPGVPIGIILILMICLLLLIIRYRNSDQLFRRHRRAAMNSNNSSHLPLVSVISNSGNSLHASKRTILPSDAIKNRASTQKDDPDVELCDPHSYPVRIEELEEFVKKALASRLLESHWKMLPSGFVKRCKYGYLPKNKPKNQCDYVIPYDDNRVKLKKSFKDSHSDYINASYVQGYGKVKGYIATQGPKRDRTTKIDTVPDFWRMIWQENVRVICMLTNLIEDGERKCEQYWPEIGTSMDSGDVFILNMDQQIFVDYTIRTFQLICRGERREIKHFHYTEWPDHGVPTFTHSLAVFVRQLLATPIEEGPMVVHGYAGIGRTGTLILCDICLRQAVNEREIDILAVTLRIREDRANMVENAQQYLLAHLVIAECKIIERTQIPCNDRLKERVDELRRMLPSDMERLKNIVWHHKALRSLATQSFTVGAASLNSSWELDQDDTVPDESSLPSGHDCQSNCFHVISVAGRKRKEQFMAIKQPSSFTLPDLANLLAEKKIELVVVLQLPDPEDTIQSDSLPNKPSSRPLSNIKLQSRVKLKSAKYYMTEKLELIDTLQDKADVQSVTILTCTEWTCERNKNPPPVDVLVSLWMASEKVKRKGESPMLVICRDGITGCGLYIALSCLLEQMSVDRECDVISSVRTVQRTNQGFVQSSEQVEYLYDAAVNYNAQFATYVDLV